jgi:CBS domain-containing protein
VGHLQVNKFDRPKDKAIYIHHLIQDLEVLETMLKEQRFDSYPLKIGAEQEFCLVDKTFSPAGKSQEILEKLNDTDFTTEIGTYNLELNSPPLLLETDCFSKLYQLFKQKLEKVQLEAHKEGLDIVLTGILPTIRPKHTSENYMTKDSRYQVLNDTLKAARQQNFQVSIKGVDELNLMNESVMLEASNTSFQTHLQIVPERFVDQYNWAQTISGPLLSSCTNSPLLFGKELWSETRIALFAQSIDTRPQSFYHQDKEGRVNFGDDWELGDVPSLFKNHIAQFTSLLSSPDLKDSKKQLKEGITPRLTALSLHNGTVYKWNRVCYGVAHNRPHLRIECRYIPSGPTLSDEIATMMLWVGLMLAQTDGFEQIASKLDFKDVKSNFFKAARYGLETQFNWFGELIPAHILLTETLMPLAKKALLKAGIAPMDIEHYFAVLEQRIQKGNGAQWTIKNYRNLMKTQTKYESLQNLSRYMCEQQFNEDGIAGWGTVDPNKRFISKDSRTVKHNMNTKVLVVNEDDSLELVFHMMKWKNIHHLPVINQSRDLVGLLSWTDLIKGDYQDLNVKVKKAMSTQLITISQDEKISEARKLMETHQINCLPVTKKQQLLGILTSNDL